MAAKKSGDPDEPLAISLADEKKRARIAAEVDALTARHGDKPTDNDADMTFAYKKMRATVTPLECPSPGAWSWWEYAQADPQKFLEIYARRDDQKLKAIGAASQQRMEDDRRRQFGMLERVEHQLQLNVTETVRELMEKFPEDVLLECKKHTEAWAAFFAKYPQA